MPSVLVRAALAASFIAAGAGAATAQSLPWPTVPGGSVTVPGGGLAAISPEPAPRPLPAIAGPIRGRESPAFPTGLEGRWSASTSCQLSATQLILTGGAMELRNRTGRLYYANVSHQRQGSDAGVQITAAPQVNRMGAAGGLLGDTYLFRIDSANRIVPVAIMRSTARRDRVGANWPAFYRCR